MYKLLIVDDEKQVREGLKKAVAVAGLWNYHNWRSDKRP